MAEADVYTKNYIGQNHIFADIFNFFVWGGKQVIKADSLSDESVEEGAVVLAGEESETAQRYRDVLKSCVIKRGEGVSYVLLGIESQESIHYAMPVRTMVYDALQYDKQVKRVAQQHRQSKDMPTKAEFLSGFTKEDRLTPVITLVVYFGDQRWDAPRSIHQMFDQTYDEHMMSFVQDYKINLIEPAALRDEDLAKFTTDFGCVMEFLKHSNDKQKMNELLAEGSPFENISTSAALVLNSCANIKIRINQNKEKTDMCKAIQEMKEEAAVNSLLKTARALMANLSWSADQALQAMSVSESDFATLKPMLQA